MKTIKINFVSFYGTINIRDNIIINMLKKHYNVELSDHPDFVFVSIFSKFLPYGICDEYLSSDCVRIMLEGENYVPDFNLVDYALSPYPINFFDRNFYIPCGIESFSKTDFKRFLALPGSAREFSREELDKKEFFCNFIVSHDSENNMRGDFFKKLSEYKRVESPGTYLNNMGDNKADVAWKEDSKPNFQRRCKFSICFESTSHNGFITEKIVDAFYAGTIPIYYGSDNISDIFNPKAFVNVKDYPDFDAVVERIREIDNDDELYMSMMREPIFNEENFPQNLMARLETFLCNIFDQEPQAAYRRSRVYLPQAHELFLKDAVRVWKKKNWFKIKKGDWRKKVIEKVKNKLGAEKFIELRSKINKNAKG